MQSEPPPLPPPLLSPKPSTLNPKTCVSGVGTSGQMERSPEFGSDVWAHARQALKTPKPQNPKPQTPKALNPKALDVKLNMFSVSGTLWVGNLCELLPVRS